MWTFNIRGIPKELSERMVASVTVWVPMQQRFLL